MDRLIFRIRSYWRLWLLFLKMPKLERDAWVEYLKDGDKDVLMQFINQYKDYLI